MTNDEMEEQFDDACDEATHAVIECFDWMNLPQGQERLNLLYQINDAITQIMQFYKPNPAE